MQEVVRMCSKNAHFCNMDELNFPPYSISLKNKENKTYVWDIIRKKNILLTPEEWVRQHCIHFLIEGKKVPPALINVEKTFTVGQRKKRYDIVVFSPTGKITLLVECKAPSVKITQATFDQIAQYNFSLKSNTLMVTNGIDHYFCQMNHSEGKYHFIKELPFYTPNTALWK